MVQANSAACSGNEPVTASVQRSSFAEDFMLEHSNSSLLIAIMGSNEGHGAAPGESHKSAQSYGFPS
jgi:hypothetical protein